MLPRVLLWGAVGLLLAGCSQELPYTLPSPSPRLVLNGVLRPDQPVRLRVTHTQPVGASLTESLAVEQATVLLLENGVLLENLQHAGNGTYYSPSGFRPKPGQAYAVRVTAAGYPEAESTPEIVPLPIQEPGYQFTESIESSLNSAYPTRKLRLRFTDDPVRADYYTIQVAAFHQGYRLTQNTYYLDQPLEADNPCGFLSGGANTLRYSLTDQCFSGRATEARFAVELRGFGQDDYRKAHPDFFGELDGDSVSVTIQKIPAAYYYYLKSGNQPDGVFLAFSEPTALHTNVRGGLGLITACNEYQVGIRVP